MKGLNSGFKSMCFVLIVIAFTGASVHAQTKIGFDELQRREAKISKMIAALPEVVRANAYCKEKSHGRWHLKTYVADAPTKLMNFYWVKVSEDTGHTFHTWFNFVVDPNKYTIKYFDTKTAKYIPLAEWRKQKNYDVAYIN